MWNILSGQAKENKCSAGDTHSQREIEPFIEYSVKHFEWTSKGKTNAVLVTHILKERFNRLYFGNFKEK